MKSNDHFRMRASMGNSGIDLNQTFIEGARHAALKRARLQRAQQMLVAAGLAALCVLVVAAALLAQSI
jgi:hypothetical protein